MRLLIILVCLGVEKMLGWGTWLSQQRLYEKYFSFLQKQLRNTPLKEGVMGIATPVLLLPLVFALVLYLIGYGLLGVVCLLINLFVLLLCLGKDPSEHVSEHTLKGILVSSYSQFFGTLFWYTVLGVFGVLVYGLTKQAIQFSEKEAQKQQARQWLSYLDWVPVRLQTLAYALAGNFSTAFVYWLDRLKSSPAENEQVLVQCGAHALSLESGELNKLNNDQKEAAHKLADRTLVILLVTIALVTLGGFIAY